MSWGETLVEDIALVKGGKRLPSSHSFADSPTDHIYIRARDIGGGKIEIKEPVYLTETTRNILQHYTVKEGDVVVTIVGANVGDVGYVNEELSGANLTENAAKLVVDKSQYDPYFLKLLLATESSKKRLAFIASGAAQGKLGLYKIKSFPVVAPPIDIQRKIAAIGRNYDDLIENNQRRIQLLEESARLLYREWFVRLRFPGHEHVKIIDGVAEGWRKKKISEVTDTYGGGTPSTKVSEYWVGGNITWFIPKDLTNNDCLVLLDSEKKITEEGLKKSSAKMLPPETILMTSRASIGYFGLYEGEACTNQGFISLVPKKSILKLYLLHNLMSRKEEILSRAGGTTYKEINKTTFRNMSLVIPLDHLLKQFDSFAYDVVKQVRILKKQENALKQARDLLLPHLMNGEIEV